MLELTNLSKAFRDIQAVHEVTAAIADGEVFGLVGTNGAGKSTLLRLIAGVLKQDRGSILIDGEPVWDNPEIKAQICFIPDSGYFPVNSTPLTMMQLWKIIYPDFQEKRFLDFLRKAGISEKRRIQTFSKGMKKQLSLFLGICANTKYLLCDETFDGLDPVVRQAVKGVLASEILDRPFVPVIASHNLRELEDICDHVGLLHKGGILLSEALDDMKGNMQKVQLVVQDPMQEETLKAQLHVILSEKRGSILTIIARGSYQEVMDVIERTHPVFVENLPLTLEEIFITETEVAGYDVRSICK
ncbi:MAG: ABC transporter ATP-binding protein [Eubacterium sp.]|nr:ABC transporter ATP-binding protein [Eubacterium sp.]